MPRPVNCFKSQRGDTTYKTCLTCRRKHAAKADWIAALGIQIAFVPIDQKDSEYHKNLERTDTNTAFFLHLCTGSNLDYETKPMGNG